jgi:hypothetical protein
MSRSFVLYEHKTFKIHILCVIGEQVQDDTNPYLVAGSDAQPKPHPPRDGKWPQYIIVI